MKQTLKRLIPAPLQPVAKRYYYAIRDPLEIWLGKRDPLTPPPHLIFVGPGDFESIGKEFLALFQDPGGLRSEDRVLDVGCGIGRMAVPLTGYLKDGSYEGFDLVEEGIRWCRKNISRRFPNFHFQQADVYNRHYHPQGKFQASEYQFPFESELFDFVFLTSVFTHMVPEDMKQYFSEVVRVLKKGGRCLMTWFLLDAEALKAIEEKRSSMDFCHLMKGYRTINPDDPESVLAYDKEDVLSLYQRYGLKILEPVHSGSWYGRPDGLSYQDIIVAVKE